MTMFPPRYTYGVWNLMVVPHGVNCGCTTGPPGYVSGCRVSGPLRTRTAPAPTLVANVSLIVAGVVAAGASCTSKSVYVASVAGGGKVAVSLLSRNVTPVSSLPGA